MTFVALLWYENIFWLVMMIVRGSPIIQIPLIEAGKLRRQMKQNTGSKDLAYGTPFGKEFLDNHKSRYIAYAYRQGLRRNLPLV
jgi:hypothetical protein